MVKLKRDVVLILVVIIIISNFWGCNNNNNVSKSNEKSITVYSLYRNEYISQSIAKYKKKNKKVKIKYEVGIDYNYSITETDAIKKLNTEITSLKGPDILILDGLPLESYEKKGLLKNINSIVDNHGNELFKNVIKCNKKNNKVYEIPLTISFQYILGEDINNIDNLKSFSNGVNNNNNNSEKVLNFYEPKELIESLYYSSASSWIDNNKNINDEKLKEFLISCKKIYDANKENITDKQLKQHEEGLENFQKNSEYFLNFSNYADVLLKNVSKYSISNISSIDDVFYINEICKRYSNIKYCKWKGQIGDFYIPKTQIAILKTSNNSALSEKFISSLLEYDYQYNLYSFGIPVNKKACLDKLCNDSMSDMSCVYGDTFNSTDDSNQVQIDNVSVLSKENANMYVEDIENYKIQANTDTTPLTQVENEMEKYILGETDLNDTLNNIKNKLQVWLDE